MKGYYSYDSHNAQDVIDFLNNFSIVHDVQTGSIAVLDDPKTLERIASGYACALWSFDLPSAVVEVHNNLFYDVKSWVSKKHDPIARHVLGDDIEKFLLQSAKDLYNSAMAIRRKAVTDKEIKDQNSNEAEDEGNLEAEY